MAKKLGVHRRMVREALADAVPRERKSAIRAKPRLEAVRSFIEAILKADQTAPRKQRHTARRIWCRIRAEMPEVDIAESSIRRFVRERNRFGSLLADWRRLRRVSQMTWALDTEISQRHISFVESGRARPSRETVLAITEALDMPLRARNELLDAAGFAAFYPERPLEGAEMDRSRETLKRILAHHDPYPAMVLDRYWNILMKNDASKRIISNFLDEPSVGKLSPDGKPNFMRMMFHPDGLKPHVRSWARTAPNLIRRLRREAAAYPGSPSESLLRELLPSAPAAFIPGIDDAPLAPTVALELEIGNEVLRLFNTLTTFGTPQDVTLQELRIEMSFPGRRERCTSTALWSREGRFDLRSKESTWFRHNVYHSRRNVGKFPSPFKLG